MKTKTKSTGVRVEQTDMSKRATIVVDWDREARALVARVVTSTGQTVYSSRPISDEKTFSEARWPAADWARENGYKVAEKLLR